MRRLIETRSAQLRLRKTGIRNASSERVRQDIADAWNCALVSKTRGRAEDA